MVPFILTFLGLGTRVTRRRPRSASAFGASKEEVVDRSVGAACVLAGVFGHALLQRATGVIHAAIARPPSLLLHLGRFVNKST